MPNVTYPLDLSGVAPTNLVQNELHTVSESHYRDYFFIVPNFSPFYIDNFSAKITTNGNTRDLVEDIDFSFAIPYMAGTRSTGKAMYGAITLHNLEMNGILSITYQTVGGDQIADRLYVLTILADKAYNPRTTIWDLLTNVPNAFPPTPHYQDYDQFYGQEEVVNKLGAIRDAIANGSIDVKNQLNDVLRLLSPGGLLDYLPISGGVMSGDLILNSDPHTDLQAATKRYIDTNLSNHATNFDLHLTAEENALIDAITVSAEEINQLSGVENNVQAQLDAKLNLTGGVLTGELILASDPQVDLQAATKHYVDIGLATKVNKAGDTMTGALLLYGEPSASNEATTKNYVDTSVNTLKAYTDTQLATKLSLAGGTLTGALTLAADPTSNLQAATKQYVDNGIESAKAYTDNEAANLQEQINSINATVNILNTDPVTKNYVDQGLDTKVNKAGDTMMGYLTLFADPSEPFHAVTKQYVDAVAQGLSVKPSVRLATTLNLEAIYDNGNQGVGATLQGVQNGELVIDGVTPVVGDRILVKDQINKKENGDYVVLQVGSSTTPFILKRDKFYDENYEIPGSYFYVYDGETLKGTGWVALVANPITFLIGRDDITITQFFGQGTYIPGNGISINGTTISVVTADSSRIISVPGYIDLAPTGINPGTYTKVTVDGFGRVMYGTNPTTLAGYGISDGQPLNANLTSLSNLTDHGIVVRDNTNSMVAKAIGVDGIGLSITNGSGADNGNIVIRSNATSENVPGTIVARDSSNNFTANLITATLNGNASTATKLANPQNFSITGDALTQESVSFDGSAPVQLNVKLNHTGVLAGRYTRVVVGEDGRITFGDNPNTVSDLGLIDAATIDYVNSQIDALNERINELYTYVLQRLG